MADAPGVAPAVKRGTARRVLQTAFTAALWIGGLFLGAGRAGWARGWISAGIYVIGDGGGWGSHVARQPGVAGGAR